MGNIFAALYLTIVVAIFKKLGNFLAKTFNKQLNSKRQTIFVNAMIGLWSVCGIVSVAADFLSRMVFNPNYYMYYQRICFLAIVVSFVIITITLLWRIKVVKRNN